MSNKVLHLRLSAGALVGCYDAIKDAGGNVQGKALSTVVSMTVEAFVNSLKRNDRIPDYGTSELLEERLAEISGAADVEIDVPELSVEDLTRSAEPTSGALVAIARGDTKAVEAAVSKAFEAVTSPNIQADSSPPTFGVEENAPPPAPLNVAPEDIMPKEMILYLSPKDRLAEVCQEHPNLWQALGVVYKNLSTDMWGSDKAELLFLDTAAQMGILPKDTKKDAQEGEKT